MNSLHTLNERGAEQASYTDNRPDGPIFSRAAPTNRTKTIEQNDDHAAVVGINVLDIVNPTAVSMYYEIDVTDLSGTTVTWNTVPAGCTTSEPSTGVYRITGIESGSIWKQVRSPTIDIPDSFTGDFDYVSTLHYTNPTTGVAETKQWTVTVTVTDVVVLSTPVEQFFVPGETQTITAPTIQTDKTGTYTITVTPTTTADITSMQATIADPDNVTSFNGGTKVFTIEGTRAQAATYLAAFSATFDGSAGNNTFTYALSCTNADVPSDSEPQTITEAVYWFPPGAAEYAAGIESTLANPGRIVNLTDPHELYNLTITATDATQINTIELQDIDYFTRDSADTTTNQSSDPDYTNYSADISDGGRLVIGMREDTDAIVEESEVNVYDYDLDANTLTHVETITISSEPGAFDVNISRNGTYLIHGDLDATEAYRYTWNGSTFGTGTALGNYARSIDQTDDGTVAVFTNFNTGTPVADLDMYLYYDSGSGFALQQTITNPDTTDGIRFGYDVSISGDGNYVAVSDPLWNGTNYEGRVYIYQRTGGSTLTLQQTLTGAEYETFGTTVELNSDGSQIYIGAPGYSNGTKPHAGRVYIYSRDDTTWSEDTAAGSPLTSPLPNGSRFGGIYSGDISVSPWVEIKINATDNILTVPNDPGSAAVFKKTDGVWSNIDVIDTHRAYTMKSGDTIYDNVLFDSDGTNIYWYRRQFGQIGSYSAGVYTVSDNLPKVPVNRALDGVKLTSTATTEDIELTYEITLEDASTHDSVQTVTHNEGIA